MADVAEPSNFFPRKLGCDAHCHSSQTTWTSLNRRTGDYIGDPVFLIAAGAATPSAQEADFVHPTPCSMVDLPTP